MQLKIDQKDRLILYELDKNARISFAELGKKIRSSEAVARYRLRRLEKLGIIKAYLTFINTNKMGYQFHNIYVKLKVFSEELEAQLVQQLKPLRSVCWLCSTTAGNYNLIIGTLARDANHFQEIYNDIIRTLEHSVQEDSVFIVTNAYQLPYPVLQDQKLELPPTKAFIDGEKIQLETIDMDILRELSGNARITTLDLAEKLHISMPTAREHLNKLFHSDLIQGFKPLLDMEKLGKQWYCALFKFKYVKPEERKKFIETLKTIPQTFFIVNGIGNWQMQAEFYCKDDHEFRAVLARIFPTEQHNVVKHHTEMRITQEHKCVFYPVDLVPEKMQKTKAALKITKTDKGIQRRLHQWVDNTKTHRTMEPELIIERRRV